MSPGSIMGLDEVSLRECIQPELDSSTQFQSIAGRLPSHRSKQRANYCRIRIRVSTTTLTAYANALTRGHSNPDRLDWMCQCCVLSCPIRNPIRSMASEEDGKRTRSHHSAISLTLRTQLAVERRANGSSATKRFCSHPVEIGNFDRREIVAASFSKISC